MSRRFLYLIFASLLLSCVREKEEKQILSGSFTARIEQNNTKTELTGSAIRFGSDESINVVCEGFNKILVGNKDSKNPNIFQGEYRLTGKIGSDCDWYALYPESLDLSETGIITGTLPSEQTAPFDPSANMMYSDIIVADYDEENMPSISLSMNQMMGLIRISFINDNADYADDILQSVQLRSSVPLCGDFSLDIHSGDLSFEGYTYKYVTSLYSSEEALGVDTQHWVTLFVNPVKITGAKLVIRTDKHTFTYTSTKKFTPVAGSLTLLPLMNLEDFVVEGPTTLKKRVVCWGDSSTSANYAEKTTYCKYLQLLLGSEWEVLNGGKSGDRTYEIAARQGALPIVTGSAFTIPAGTKTITIDGFLRTHSVLGVPGYYPIRSFGGAFVNPCKLVGTKGEEVLCTLASYREISGTDTTYFATLRRVTAGDPIEIAEHTPIETYAARELRDVDLTILLIGAAGQFGSDNEKKLMDYTRWDNLADQCWEMINFTAHSDSYIVLGHYALTMEWDSKGYSAYMGPMFGDRYLNLRLPVVESRESIIKWLLYSGLYADESEIPQEEVDRSLLGHWPRPLQHTYTDRHPNEYGTKVMAKIVYDRMKELGYLD